MLELINVDKKIGRKHILKDINLRLEDGVYGLLGPNGAGKTTLMRCILNIYKLSNGDIKFEDVSVVSQEKFLEEIGYLPQKFGLFKELKVREMMRYIANLKNLPKEIIEDDIERCVQRVNLTDRLDNKVGTLSGGMIRRLGIAQALLGDPKLIIVDEPTAGLDPEERMRFKNIITEIKKDRIIIISTHIVDDIDALCDKIIVMDKGSIAFLGTNQELRNIALNHVFDIPETMAQNLENFEIIRRYEKGDERYIKIVGSGIDAVSSEPDLESAYICLLRKIV